MSHIESMFASKLQEEKCNFNETVTDFLFHDVNHDHKLGNFIFLRKSENSDGFMDVFDGWINGRL